MIDEPLHEEDEDSGSDIFIPRVEASHPTKSSRSRRILAIEDSKVQFLLIERFLRLADHIDLEVTHAMQLADGLEYLSRERFDAVLLDLNLPDSMGLDTLRRTKASAPNVPIVVLTGMDDESVAIEAVREGAEDFLVKGEFNRDLLIRALRYAIARHSGRVKLQQALNASQISEDNLHSIIASNVDGMVVLDQQGVVQFLNPVARSLFRQLDVKTERLPIEIPLASGEPTEIEIRLEDGRDVPVEVRSMEMVWQGDHARLVVFRDLTHQKQAQIERARLTAIVQSTGNAVLSADLNGTVLTWNPGAEKIFGYAASEAIGSNVSMLWPAGHEEKAAAIIEKVAQGGRISELETVRRRKDGSKIDVSLSVFPIYGARDEVVSVGAIVADITERKRAQDELEKQQFELETAQAIQQRLQPQSPPSLPGFDIAGAVFPAEFAAGDYYDFVPLANGAMGFVVGDVSGHGVGPAMLMATTRAHLRTLAQTDHDVGGILARLNQLLVEETREEHFVTLVFAQLDPRTHSLVYSSAGHSAGYVLNSSGELKRELHSTSVPLAIVPHAEFPLGESFQLELGDTVLLPTDGLHEAPDPNGRLLGREKMLDVVRRNRHRTAHEIVQSLRQSVREFSQRETLMDDLTAVVIKVQGPR